MSKQVLFISIFLLVLTSSCSQKELFVEGDLVLAEQAENTEWTNRLIKKGKLNSPLGEITPFVFNNRLYRLENWAKMWDHPIDLANYSKMNRHHFEDEVSIRDMETGETISKVMSGYGFAAAFVWQGKVYVYAGKHTSNRAWHIKEVYLTTSEDLVNWSKPKVVLTAEEQEYFYNYGVCHDGKRFVLLAETNDPAWPSYTFKYFESDDLVHWKRVTDAVYGRDKYVGGPALYYAEPYYYTLYLERISNGWETRITRSKDLVTWQDAPAGRAVVTFDPKNKVHPLRGADVNENNASDAEACEWHGKTIVEFSCGDQHVAGDLQWAEFDGSMREFLEHYFE